MQLFENADFPIKRHVQNQYTNGVVVHIYMLF